MLLEKIEKDFKQAISKGNAEKLACLRMLKTSLHNKEIELKPKKEKLTDEIVVEIVQRELKKRKEAIQMYEKGDRKDLSEKEKKELEILSEYLPEVTANSISLSPIFLRLTAPPIPADPPRSNTVKIWAVRTAVA